MRMHRFLILAVIAALLSLVPDAESSACGRRHRHRSCGGCSPCCQSCGSGVLETCDAGASGIPCQIHCLGLGCYAAVIDGVCLKGCVDGCLPCTATTSCKTAVKRLVCRHCSIRYLDALLGFQKWGCVGTIPPHVLDSRVDADFGDLNVEEIAHILGLH